MTPAGIEVFGRMCGWTLARAHARSGDRVAISAYLGDTDAFDRALLAFAETYADQAVADHGALVDAIARGRLPPRRLRTRPGLDEPLLDVLILVDRDRREPGHPPSAAVRREAGSGRFPEEHATRASQSRRLDDAVDPVIPAGRRRGHRGSYACTSRGSSRSSWLGTYGVTAVTRSTRRRTPAGARTGPPRGPRRRRGVRMPRPPDPRRSRPPSPPVVGADSRGDRTAPRAQVDRGPFGGQEGHGARSEGAVRGRGRTRRDHAIRFPRRSTPTIQANGSPRVRRATGPRGAGTAAAAARSSSASASGATHPASDRPARPGLASRWSPRRESGSAAMVWSG